MKANLPNEIAALPPWLAGYEMGADDVALLTFAEDGQALSIAASAVIPLNETGEDFDAITRETAQRLVTANGGTTTVVFVVGHGPNGDLHADRVIEGIRPGLPSDTRIMGVLNAGDTVSARTETGPWAPSGPPADVSAQMTAMGIPAPAASRAMSDRMWQPDPVPGYPGLPTQERAALEAAPPSKRAAVALELLMDLANGLAEDVATTQSRVAALFTSNTQHWVQDHILMTAVTADSPALADELRRLYVAAPPEDQPSIAATAAIAAFAQHSTSQPLRAVRDQNGESNLSASDRPLMDALASGATPPRDFKRMLAAVHQQVITDDIPAVRDAAWRTPHRPAPSAPESRDIPSPAPTSNPPQPGPSDLPFDKGPSGPALS